MLERDVNGPGKSDWKRYACDVGLVAYSKGVM